MVFVLIPSGVTAERLVVEIFKKFTKCVVTCSKRIVYIRFGKTMTIEEIEKVLPCKASIKT